MRCFDPRDNYPLSRCRKPKPRGRIQQAIDTDRQPVHAVVCIGSVDVSSKSVCYINIHTDPFVVLLTSPSDQRTITMLVGVLPILLAFFTLFTSFSSGVPIEEDSLVVRGTPTFGSEVISNAERIARRLPLSKPKRLFDAARPRGGFLLHFYTTPLAYTSRSSCRS